MGIDPQGKPSSIALIWELGASFGHLGSLIPVSMRLRERGHDPTLILRELRNLAHVSESRDFRVLQAPVWLAHVSGLPEPPLNYSEILLRYGYHDAHALTAQLRAWRDLLTLIRPQAVLLEHAPTAALAARLLDIPSVAVGGTFNIPPAQSPLPNMRPWHEVPEIRLSSSDELVLNTINQALENLGGAPLGGMNELFAATTNLLCTYPELDHYPSRNGGRYIGPLFMPQSGVALEWPASGGKRIFAYLAPSARSFSEILEILSASPHSVIMISPGLSDKMCAQYTRNNMILSSKPCRLETLASTCDLAITAGNNGTVSFLLSQGVPQLMFAQHLEHYLFGRRVMEMGAGETIAPDAPMPPLQALLDRMLDRREYRHNAQAFAARHSGSNVEQRIELVTDTVEAVMKEFK
jgi:UDP:flavonoid glycosyltransferase YjiC (YdhE family)